MKETESDKSLKISASPKKPVYILVGWRFLYVSLRDDPSADGLQNAMNASGEGSEGERSKEVYLASQATCRELTDHHHQTAESVGLTYRSYVILKK